MKSRFIVALTIALPLRFMDAGEPSRLSYTGETYPFAAAGNSVFSVERYWSTNGDKKILTEAFKNTGGSTVASLETSYVADRLALIRFEQKQTGETATAEFKDGRVVYSTLVNGKAKTSEAGAPGQWVAFNAVPECIGKNWETLEGGGTVNFRMPVPIMRDSFGFSLSRTKTWTENGQKRSEFKLESSSAIVRMLAAPMYYVFNDNDRTLLEFRGRTIAKLNGNGKLKDLDATVKYHLRNQ